MTRPAIVRYLNPRMFRRDERQQQLDALRQRDGDNCRRCRRPLRFDVPSGHDKAPTLLPTDSEDAAMELENLCLCHVRCNGEAADNTEEVLERLRLRA
jgi:hypothetical protein